jgi:hypothetical protein
MRKSLLPYCKGLFGKQRWDEKTWHA